MAETSKAVDKSKPGWEHFVDYGDGFHERLSSNWPEPREQLHAGGWRVTRRLEKLLALDKRNGSSLLDLCCGEGSTACYYAKKYPEVHITGVDIVKKAIANANELAVSEGVQDRVKFIAANAFEMPFADGTFDCIYGQDPDAMSHQDRILLFKELLRVLKPGGQFVFMHHWIPGPGFPKEEAKAIDEFNANLKFLAMDDCNGDRYLADLAKAGFKIDSYDDLTDLAAAHMRGVALLHMMKLGEIKDKWIINNLKYIDRGLPFGLQATCTKPGGDKSKPVKAPLGDPTGFVLGTALLVAIAAWYYIQHHQQS